MNPSLQEETARLARSWMRHEAATLRDYLAQDVEDPRLNVQSILTRHFLLEQRCGTRHAALQEHELRFAVVANWLLGLLRQPIGPDELAAVWHALQRGADNAEGLEIPASIVRIAAAWSSREPSLGAPQAEVSEGVAPCSVALPNYLESLLLETEFSRTPPRLAESVLDTFPRLWREVLAETLPEPCPILELACGSANDYRALAACGLARCLDYTGLDLCEKNVANARALFPGARFVVGNAFDLPWPDGSFACAFAHDLYEHLSPAGLETALSELGRVTRRAFCLGFFNMHEADEPIVRPHEEYHWNTLSLPRVRAALEGQGFCVQAIHIATYLSRRFGCAQTHNPNAYTLVGRRSH